MKIWQISSKIVYSAVFFQGFFILCRRKCGEKKFGSIGLPGNAVSVSEPTAASSPLSSTSQSLLVTPLEFDFSKQISLLLSL